MYCRQFTPPALAQVRSVKNVSIHGRSAVQSPCSPASPEKIPCPDAQPPAPSLPLRRPFLEDGKGRRFSSLLPVQSSSRAAVQLCKHPKGWFALFARLLQLCPPKLCKWLAQLHCTACTAGGNTCASRGLPASAVGWLWPRRRQQSLCQHLETEKGVFRSKTLRTPKP
jgi:hypothetical protein